MSTYPKGSMGAADEKQAKAFKIAFTIVTLVIMALSFLNLAHTFLGVWFSKAGAVAHVFGFLLFTASIVVLWKGGDWFSNSAGAIIVWLLLLAAGIGMSSGFNFSL